MKSFIIGSLCGVFLIACLEDAPGEDAVPIDHSHPDMVPADHEHPEAQAVEPNETTGLYALEISKTHDTCGSNPPDMPTEYQSAGNWYMALTQNEYLLFSTGGGSIFTSQNGAEFVYSDHTIRGLCEYQEEDWRAALNFTEYGFDGAFSLIYSESCLNFNTGEIEPVDCAANWQAKGERLK